MTLDDETRVIHAYRDLYDQRRLWQKMKWRGHDVAKTPEDMWLYQEVIAELKPQLIVEFGTNMGGTALFYADILDLMVGGNSKVLSIDIKDTKGLPQHPRLTYHVGHSRHDEAFALVSSMASTAAGPVMFIEDSEHTATHVAAELEMYHHLVTVNSYFVCEDCGWPDHPNDAQRYISAFLSDHRNFKRDVTKSKYMLTMAPNGWLKRVG